MISYPDSNRIGYIDRIRMQPESPDSFSVFIENLLAVILSGSFMRSYSDPLSLGSNSVSVFGRGSEYDSNQSHN